jgi:hypothetical protein
MYGMLFSRNRGKPHKKVPVPVAQAYCLVEHAIMAAKKKKNAFMAASPKRTIHSFTHLYLMHGCLLVQITVIIWVFQVQISRMAVINVLHKGLPACQMSAIGGHDGMLDQAVKFILEKSVCIHSLRSQKKNHPLIYSLLFDAWASHPSNHCHYLGIPSQNKQDGPHKYCSSC